MSKALTPVNQNYDREIDLIAERLIARERNAHSPSYFGNFGIFNPFSMLCVGARLSMQRLGNKPEFTRITAFMAIV
ncbi:MAG TPA: hypothetical protein VLK27_10450 [Chthoniobacterales bacterium]|nr:hypothetical protein [Chthoniobacterales bacterium]